MWFSLTFPVCSKFPDFSLTGKCLPIFPVRVGTLLVSNLFDTFADVFPAFSSNLWYIGYWSVWIFSFYSFSVVEELSTFFNWHDTSSLYNCALVNIFNEIISHYLKSRDDFCFSVNFSTHVRHSHCLCSIFRRLNWQNMNKTIQINTCYRSTIKSRHSSASSVHFCLSSFSCLYSSLSNPLLFSEIKKKKNSRYPKRR